MAKMGKPAMPPKGMPPKGMPPKGMPPKGGSHMMPGGRMMSDAEMQGMMYGGKPGKGAKKK